MTTAQRAYALGYAHGVNLGSWAIDGNTSIETACAIITGYEDGDPEVMDMQPSPLSGEWADEPTPRTVLAELDVDEDSDEAGDLLDEYENAFGEGFWDEVLRSARIIAGEDVAR